MFKTIDGVHIEMTADEMDEMQAQRLIDSSLPPIVPASASKLGLMRSFKEMGIWNEVKNALANDEDAQEEWDLAVEVRRSDRVTERFIGLLELDDPAVDALLIRANELVA